MTRMKHALAAIALAGTASCTVLGLGAGAGVTAIHNNGVDEGEKWGYGIPVTLGGIVGLLIDIYLLNKLEDSFKKTDD